MKKKINHAEIGCSAAWKVVRALCAIYGINDDDRDEDSFYNVLVRKCFEEAKKQAETSR